MANIITSFFEIYTQVYKQKFKLKQIQTEEDFAIVKEDFI